MVLVFVSLVFVLVVFEGLPVLMLSHPRLPDAFPITKLGGWVGSGPDGIGGREEGEPAVKSGNSPHRALTSRTPYFPILRYSYVYPTVFPPRFSPYSTI